MFVIQGNDKGGKETGILTKNGDSVVSVRSHQYDFDENGNRLFKDDFLEYEIQTPSKFIFWLLAAHFQAQIIDDKVMFFV